MMKPSDRLFRKLAFGALVILLAMRNLLRIHLDGDNKINNIQDVPESTESRTGGIGKKDSKGNDKKLDTRNKADVFQWDFINPSKPGMCGFNKCFFRGKKRDFSLSSSARSKTTYPYKFDLGYLVAYNTKECNLTLGWQLANHLEDMYGLRHLYDAPPDLITVTPRLVNFTKKAIASKVKKKFYVKVLIEEFIKRSQEKDFAKSPSKQHVFEVQRVRIPKPRPILEWGDNGKRNRKCKKELPKFLSSISDKLTFGKHLLREIKSLDRVVEKEPWILHDFQVLIDQKGNILHIDLDRKPPSLNMNATTLENKHIGCMNALKVIAFKVIANTTNNDPDILPEELLAIARKHADRYQKKIC